MTADLTPELWEQCVRALYHAPADKPSLASLLDLADTDMAGFRAALELAYAAGRESAGELVEADTKIRYESTNWFADGDTEEFSYSGNGGEREYALENARNDATATDVVRTEARTYRQHTYRVGTEVIGRFGDWSEVS